MMNNTEFIWSDELIWEFLSSKAFMSRNLTHLKVQLDEFKESKQPKPECEIIEYIRPSNGRIYQKTTSGEWCSTDGRSCFSDESIKDPKSLCKIYSVKRLLDEHVFYLEEKVTANSGCELTISKFEETGDKRIRVYTYEYGYWFLDDIKKVVKVLFTTEDGVEVINGDLCVCSVGRSTYEISQSRADIIQKGHHDHYLYFSSWPKAQEYVLMNKPLISIHDLKTNVINHSVYKENYVELLMNIAKEKLNKS